MRIGQVEWASAHAESRCGLATAAIVVLILGGPVAWGASAPRTSLPGSMVEEYTASIPKRMAEARPGLFFLPQGEALDLRRPRLSFRNMPLFSVKDQPRWPTALWSLGLFCILAFWPVRVLVRRVCRPAGSAASPCAPAWLGMSGSLAALASLIVLAILVVVPNLRYVPWPAPYPQVQWWATALLGLPYAGLVLASCTGVGVALACRGKACLWPDRICYAAGAAAVLAFNAAVLM